MNKPGLFNIKYFRADLNTINKSPPPVRSFFPEVLCFASPSGTVNNNVLIRVDGYFLLFIVNCITPSASLVFFAYKTNYAGPLFFVEENIIEGQRGTDPIRILLKINGSEFFFCRQPVCVQIALKILEFVFLFATHYLIIILFLVNNRVQFPLYVNPCFLLEGLIKQLSMEDSGSLEKLIQ